MPGFVQLRHRGKLMIIFADAALDSLADSFTR
jgi:hypothetical protein